MLFHRLQSRSRLFKNGSGLLKTTKLENQLTPLLGRFYPFGSLVHTFSTSSDHYKLIVPSLGDSITEGTVVEFQKQTGDVCAIDDVVAVIETDKVSVDVRSPVSGTVHDIIVSTDDSVEVGTPLCLIEVGNVIASDVDQLISAQGAKVPRESDPIKTEASVAKKIHSNASSVEDDDGTSTFREERRVKMSRMRRRIAQRLKDSQNTTAMLTTFNEVDMTNVVKIRNSYKGEFEEQHGVKLGFMSFFVKACAESLQSNPSVNAVIDDETNEVIYRDYVDISIAVASPRGLVVPVLRNVDSMTFLDVEKNISIYSTKASNDALSLEEMSGGTFTISNGGVFGSMLGTPIINPPQSAILGMHAIKNRPTVVGNEILPRPIMYLALTYDHRLIDGREAVTFLRTICDKLENPSRMLLSL